MPSYDLRYETGTGRCAWCWEELPDADTHTAVSAVRPPALELRFHHPCWDAYRATSGIELGAVGTADDWTPERIESLRISTGMTMRTFARELGASESTYVRILQGDRSALGPGIRSRLKRVAAAYRANVSEIDWSDPRALFCLRMTLGLKLHELAKAIGASTQSVPIWDRDGVPRRSVRTWGRLNRLAKRKRFDAAQIIDDRLWTTEHLRRVIKESGRSLSQWASVASTSYQSIQQYAAGTRPIHREAAWRLTRAATSYGVELPPIGRVGYRKGTWSHDRKQPSAEDEAKRIEALRESKWTLEGVRLLGTEPDREIAAKLDRSRNSVAIMRRNLGIDSIDARYWDGQPRRQAISDDELRERWKRFKEATKERGREFRKATIEADRG